MRIITYDESPPGAESLLARFAKRLAVHAAFGKNFGNEWKICGVRARATKPDKSVALT
jgi:hypothetical protein